MNRIQPDVQCSCVIDSYVRRARIQRSNDEEPTERQIHKIKQVSYSVVNTHEWK